MNALRAGWEARYAAGRDSGAGSRGHVAAAKAAFVNGFLQKERVRSVVDWGCGDGGQLALLEMPGEGYLGIDISASAVARAMGRHPTRQFLVLDPRSAVDVRVRAELALSMDVLFHLVDDQDFRRYLRALFASASRFVLIYSTDHDAPRRAPHVLHRNWTPYVAQAFPGWRLVGRPGPAKEIGFFLYRKAGS